MKLLSIILVNLAVVAVALVIYDHQRSDALPEGTEVEGSAAERKALARRVDVLVDSSAAEREALARRLDGLEAQRGPELHASGIDPRVLARLSALEEALHGRAPADDQGDGGPVLAGRAATEDAPPSPTTSSNEPSEEDIRWFRRLQGAVRFEELVEKLAPRIDKGLDSLSLRLSKQQRARIHTAFARFQPRMAHIWTEVKTAARKTVADGGTIDRGEIVTTTAATVQQEFAKTLEGVVSSGDADAIAATLLPGGR